MSAFTLQDGAVYQTYATTWRGVEFLMGYYPILDRAPKGRDEGDAGSSGFAADEYAAGDACGRRRHRRRRSRAASAIVAPRSRLRGGRYRSGETMDTQGRGRS